jgi:hypothetical protein
VDQRRAGAVEQGPEEERRVKLRARRVAVQHVDLVAMAPELLDLVGKAAQPVADAMRERGLQKAAVASARPDPAAGGLEHDDLAPGIERLGVQRGP